MLCELIQDLDLHSKVPDKVSRGAQIMEEYKKGLYSSPERPLRVLDLRKKLPISYLQSLCGIATVPLPPLIHGFT